MIKGLSQIRRCPRLGKIRLGEKVPVQGKENVTRPKETEYFLLDAATGNPARDKQLEDQFKSLYGAKPTRIIIMFPPVDREIFFQQFNKRYGSSTLLKCKGEGNGSTEELIGEAVCSLPEFAQGLETIGNNEMGQIKVKCLGPECIYQQKKECHRVGSLQIILPELDAIGVWQCDTGSWNSIVNINSAIDWLIGMCGRYKMISIPLIRMPQEIAHVGPDGKQSKGKHYILQIDLQVSIAKLQQAALIAPEKSMLSLPEPEETKEEIVDAEQNGPEPRVEKVKEVFQVNKLETWDIGDVSRFGAKKEIAVGLAKTIKQCYDILGKERFLYCVGNEGWEYASQINSMEKLTNFVNVLLCEKRAKEAE